MNKISKGVFSLILIAALGFSAFNLAVAKDYSANAGDWQVDFKSNDTLYTDVVWNAPTDSMNGYYAINVKEDPGITTRAAIISILNLKYLTPVGKEIMDYYINTSFASFNETPKLSRSVIDGENIIIAEGWANNFGRMAYQAIYPLDVRSNRTTNKLASFVSLLDTKTSLEIINSIRFKRIENPTNDAKSGISTNNWVYQSAPQETAQSASTNPSIVGPYVLIKCQGTLYNQIGQFTKADPGKVYLVTNLQIENHGYDEFSVNPNYVKVEINNVQYDYSWVSVSDLGLASLDSVTLKDGGVITGAVAFEIPSNTNEYALVWKAWESYNVKVEYVK